MTFNINDPKLPDHVKGLTKAKRKVWVGVFNTIFQKENEEAALIKANAAIKEDNEMKTFKDLLKEVAPLKSFEDLRMKVREKLELMINLDPFIIKFDEFQNPIQRKPWIAHMFPSHVIAEWMDVLYKVDYKVNKKGEVSLGSVKKVDQVFVAKESESVEDVKGTSEELKETGITITNSAKDMDFEFHTLLSEASFDSDRGEVIGVLIEAGTNMGKRRHYPKSAIQEAAAGFAGLKMYINHPTAHEDKTRPERDLRDWASTVQESWYENGKAMAKIAVHDSWLRERLADPVARGHIGLSINASGKISKGKVPGNKGDFQIVEKIILERSNGPASVDWVTEAGARGRVSKLLRESNKKENKMELSEATFDDLKSENPKLLKDITSSIKESVVKEIKESEETKAKDKAIQEKDDKLKKYEVQEKQNTQKTKVAELLKESKASDLVKDRVSKVMEGKLYESEEDLKEAFQSALKDELAYFNQISSKGKIKTGGSHSEKEEGGDLLESAQSSLDARAGVKEEKKEEDK